MTKALLEIIPTQAHLAELDEAVAAVLRRGTPLIAVTAQHVPLPTLAPVLRECAAAVVEGAGVAVVRGVAAGRGTYESRLRLWALGLHLGVATCQTEVGHMVRGADDCASHGLTTETGFHTDDADVTAFLAETPSELDVAVVDAGRRTVHLGAGDLAVVDNHEALHTAPSGQVHRLWLERHDARDLPSEFTWTTTVHRGLPTGASRELVAA